MCVVIAIERLMDALTRLSKNENVVVVIIVVVVVVVVVIFAISGTMS